MSGTICLYRSELPVHTFALGVCHVTINLFCLLHSWAVTLPTVNGTSDLFHCMVPLKNDQSIIITTLHYDVNTHYSSCTWTTANTTTSLPSIGSTLTVYTWSTLCYWVYPLLLGLPSAIVYTYWSTLCYCLYILVYPLLLFIHTGLPNTTGSTLCYYTLNRSTLNNKSTLFIQLTFVLLCLPSAIHTWSSHSLTHLLCMCTVA